MRSKDDEQSDSDRLRRFTRMHFIQGLPTTPSLPAEYLWIPKGGIDTGILSTVGVRVISRLRSSISMKIYEQRVTIESSYELECVARMGVIWRGGGLMEVLIEIRCYVELACWGGYGDVEGWEEK